MLRGADGLISFTLDPATNPNLSYELYSPHGDTTMIMDSSGNPFFTARYDAFGNAISGAGLYYGYTGKYERYTDLSTGTTQMGVREYDPSLGRFISQDPLKGTPTDPQQRNRYSYVGNDPLTRYDLSGLYPGESYVDAAVGTWNDWREGGVSALANDYWQGYNTMPRWAQAADTGVILGGMTFLDLYSMGAFSPMQGEYASELLSEEGSIGLGRDATCGKGMGNIPGGEASIDQVLSGAVRWLGEGYREIGPGVFRSADGTRQFRMVYPNDLAPRIGSPHVNFEYINPVTGKPMEIHISTFLISEDFMNLEIPKKLNEVWEENCKVEAFLQDSEIGPTVTISTNNAGLTSLAKLFLFIANEENEENYHVHFDVYSGLESSSNVGLIIQKANFESKDGK